MRVLDQFSVVIFDLHGTLMFGQDRYGPDEDFYPTYTTLGGSRLSHRAVNAAMRSCVKGILGDYNSEDRFDDFPSVPEAFEKYTDVADEDVEILEAVFAEHERGHLPLTYVAFLRRLSTTHQLGILSNICARPDTWIQAFASVGLRDLFTSMVFSSEGRSIKPSRKIFERAMSPFAANSRILFVGDSLTRDIRPARALGLGTAWVAPTSSEAPEADVIVTRVTDLESLEL